MMRTHSTYSQQLSHIMYSSDNYIYHVVCNIRSSQLSYNWKFVPFGSLNPIPPPPPTTLFFSDGFSSGSLKISVPQRMFHGLICH